MSFRRSQSLRRTGTHKQVSLSNRQRKLSSRVSCNVRLGRRPLRCFSLRWTTENRTTVNIPDSRVQEAIARNTHESPLLESERVRAAIEGLADRCERTTNCVIRIRTAVTSRRLVAKRESTRPERLEQTVLASASTETNGGFLLVHRQDRIRQAEPQRTGTFIIRPPDATVKRP